MRGTKRARDGAASVCKDKAAAGDSALGNGLAGVVPIDQPVMCITSPVLLERYCARVSAVLESLVRRPSAVGAPDDVFYNAVIRCL